MNAIFKYSFVELWWVFNTTFNNISRLSILLVEETGVPNMFFYKIRRQKFNKDIPIRSKAKWSFPKVVDYTPQA
jgi:hypothetical protein